jgi:glycosyltransferase involved in cell wall biosynthesis
VLPKRLINLVTISISLFLRLLMRLRRGEKVLVVTNPPPLPFLAGLACRLRGAQCVLLIHDIYPDVAVASGLLRADSCLVRWLQRCVRRLYRSVDTIVVLGRDMREVVLQRCPKDQHRVAVIPNWADVEDVRPEPRAQNRLLREHGLLDKFVVQYAGNMGRVHDIEALVRCAGQLRQHDAIHLLILGSGAKKAGLERAIVESRLTNVTLLPPFPRSASSECLNACDVAINALVPGMQGLSVPSRTYNILAAGKPIIAATDRDSELARVIREEDVGWVVAPGDALGMARAILEARACPDALAAMGRRARLAAETKYPFPRILSAFVQVMQDHTGVLN